MMGKVNQSREWAHYQADQNSVTEPSPVRLTPILSPTSASSFNRKRLVRTASTGSELSFPRKQRCAAGDRSAAPGLPRDVAENRGFARQL